MQSSRGYCSMWPRWVDGRTVHPAACCSTISPMRALLPLSLSPMRAAGSGLPSRVGLFNLSEDNNQPLVYRMDGFWRWYVTQLFHYQMLQMQQTQIGPGIYVHFINRLSVMNVTGEFLKRLSAQFVSALSGIS